MKRKSRKLKEYALIDAFTGKKNICYPPAKKGKTERWRIARTDWISKDFDQTGTYYLKAGQLNPPRFSIDPEFTMELPGFLLNYMRQQRCGL